MKICEPTMTRWRVSKAVAIMVTSLWVPASACERAPAYSEQHELQMAVVVCNQAGVNKEGLVQAEGQVRRIFGNAGVEINWTDAGRNCVVPPLSNYFLVIISPRPPAGWTSGPDSMGLAIRSETYHRAYVFYSRLKEIATTVKLLHDLRASSGVILGHAIAHELGHLLLRGKGPSGEGIMREQWDYQQWMEASAETLLFQPEDIEAIHDELSRDRIAR